MTIDDRLSRIEPITAGMAEERRREREEDRQLWRDTQRQINDLSVRINELTLKIADTNDTVTRLAEETRAGDRQLREADQRLGERIDALVPAIGKFISK